MSQIMRNKKSKSFMVFPCRTFKDNFSVTRILFDWVAVVAAFSVYFVADGTVLTFGHYYKEIVRYFPDGRQTIAVTGALLHGLPLLLSPLACTLVTVFGCRKTAIYGCLITAIGYFFSGFVFQVEWLLFTIGALCACGLAITYVSVYLFIAFKFKKQRGIATGIAVSGSGVGITVLAHLMPALIDAYGWHGALILTAGLHLQIIVCVMFFSGDSRSASSKSLTSGSSQSELDFFEPLSDRTVKSYTTREKIAFPKLHRSVEHPIKSQVWYSQLNISVTASREDIHNVKKLHDQYSRDLINSRPHSCPDIYLISPRRRNRISSCCGGGGCDSGQDIVSEIRSQLAKLISRDLLCRFSFLTFLLHSLVLMMWMALPYLYLPDEVLTNFDSSPADAESLSKWVISVLGASTIIGQVVTGFISDRRYLRVLTLYGVCITMAGVCLFFTPLTLAISSSILLSVCCALYGFFVSVNYALLSNVLVEMIGIGQLANAFSLVQVCQGIGALSGLSLPGVLYETTGSYTLSYYVGGLLIALSGVILWAVSVFCPGPAVSKHVVTFSDSPQPCKKPTAARSGGSNKADSSISLADDTARPNAVCCTDCVENQTVNS